QAEQELLAHPAPRLQGPAERRVDELLVELVGRMTEELDDHRREDRHEDEQDHRDAAGERDLVALEPHPGDLSQGAPLDLLTVDAREHRLRLRFGVGPAHLDGCGHAPYLLPSGHWFGLAAGAEPAAAKIIRRPYASRRVR